jgi:uncharacterized protein YkwD
LFYLTNEIRQKKGLSVLEYNPLLEESATIHSESMVKHHYFSHENHKSRSLRTPDDRAKSVGITNPHMAENIIEGFVLEYKAGISVYPGGPGIFRLKPEDDPIEAHTYLSLGEVLLDDWMNSPNHRHNILVPQALELGCGTAFYSNKDFNYMPTVIATQNFQLYEPSKITK